MNLCLIKLKVRLFEGMLFDYLFYILNIAKIILKRSAYILTFHPRIEKSNLFILLSFLPITFILLAQSIGGLFIYMEEEIKSANSFHKK